MIEFEDLTPWDRDELINFYPVDWYVWMTNPVRQAPAGFEIKGEYSDYDTGLFNKLVCGKVIPTRKGLQYSVVICLLKKGHKGECLCWTPEDGIISRL